MVFTIHTPKRTSHNYTYVSPHPEPPIHFPPHCIPLGCPRVPALGVLLHASNSQWSSVLHMVMFMFQCYFFKSSYPCLLPLSLKVFFHLCIFCCPAFRIVGTIFLNSIYMNQYTILVFLFLTFFSLYNRLQVHPPH